MFRAGLIGGRALALATCFVSVAALTSCGGGSHRQQPRQRRQQDYLSVEASDADGDTLTYQWRVTGGTIDNRNASDTVWTMPASRGIHFAYVTVSDGRGGYVEQQYAVNADDLDLLPPGAGADRARSAGGRGHRRRHGAAALRVCRRHALPAGRCGSEGASRRLPPDVQVQLVEQATGTLVFGGTTDLNGELDLPKLVAGTVYTVRCASQGGAPLQDCRNFVAGDEATLRNVAPVLTDAQNLRLFGHVAPRRRRGLRLRKRLLRHPKLPRRCSLRLAGAALGTPVHVNRFGDYQISAAVPVRGALQLEVRCEGYLATLDVPASPDPAGYVATVPIELSHVMTNARPASRPDGRQRRQRQRSRPDGRPRQRRRIQCPPWRRPLPHVQGVDTRLSACLYYRRSAPVADCDAQGNPSGAISFSDWKTKNGFGLGADVAANYINQRDLNLLRRMVATRSSSGGIAFYVCNAPAPTASRRPRSTASSRKASTTRTRSPACAWSTRR
jgi:hypothetical protein